MPRLSIVIPVWGNLHLLEDTLVSVLENRPAHCEIIVVLDGPYDDPYQLTDELSYVLAPSGASLAESANLGIAASEAPVVHLLLEDHQLYAATELGDFQVLDLELYYRDHCDIMREVWQEVPVVWDNGLPVARPPDPSHRCVGE